MRAAAGSSGLDAFFNPRTVAVVGASRTPGKAGYAQIVNLQRSYRGRICPVNPNAGEVLGIPAFTSLRAIPGPVDLAIILLQATAVPAAVRECVALQVPAVLIASAGFAEAGPEGAQLQRRIIDTVRGTPTRVWGPNCNGLVSTGSGLLASFVDLPGVHAGPVAIVSQTGVFAAALLNQLMEIPSFGVSKVATLGNICDVNELDLLEYLADDDATGVIALYLEGFRDGRRLVELCRELTRRKPVIALVAGCTEAGAQASMSHTANLAADARVTRCALLQAGVVLADEFTGLIHLARAFACTGRVAPAARVAVLTTTGGAGVVAADQLASHGLAIARLSPDTQCRLNEIHPLLPDAANPLDIWPAMQAHGTNDAVAALLAPMLGDPGVDAAVLIMGAFSGGGTEFDPSRLREVLRAHGKPSLAWLYGPAKYLRAWEEALAGIGVPVYADLRMVASALAGIDALAAYRARPAVVENRRDATAMRSAARIIAAARAQGARTLTEPEGYRLLESFGLAAAPWELAADPAAAVAAARRLGFPVVLKIVSRQILHKTEVGGVVAGLPDAESVAGAAAAMRTAVGIVAPNAHIEGFLVQRMVKGRFEVIAGVTRSPQFGPAVMLGLGGIFVEAIGRVEFALPPLDAPEVDRMIAGTGIDLLLDARGGPRPADRAALRAAVRALGELAAGDLGIEQVEINPLVVLADGSGVAAVDALIVLG